MVDVIESAVDTSSKNYIKNAMSYFTNSIFLVFSNNDEDITWCEENIKGKNVYYSKGHNDLIDFTLMRMCDHNIIANSTFSWWAAYLNKTAKEVFLPNKWMNPNSSSHIINNQYNLPYNKNKEVIY